jgi:hypothetical protein
LKIASRSSAAFAIEGADRWAKTLRSKSTTHLHHWAPGNLPETAASIARGSEV